MNQSKIKEVLKKEYGFEDIGEFNLLREGSDNIVYSFVSNGKKYIFRISKKNKHQDIKFEAEVILGLLENNFPAPRIIRTSKNQSYLVSAGGVSVAFEYVEGVQIEVSLLSSPSIDSIRLAAEGLAKMHNLTKNIELDSSTSRTIYSELERVVKSIDIFLKNFENGREYVEEIKEVVEWAKGQDDLLGVIHNDFRAHNIIFTEDFSRIKAIIDFDWSCHGPYIKDLALALVEWSFPDGADKYDEEAFNLFLNTYNQHSAIIINDSLELRKWISFSCLSDSATYFCDRLEAGSFDKKILKSYMYSKYKFFKENSI